MSGNACRATVCRRADSLSFARSERIRPKTFSAPGHDGDGSAGSGRSRSS
jgi:hypothetical protein